MKPAEPEPTPAQILADELAMFRQVGAATFREMTDAERQKFCVYDDRIREIPCPPGSLISDDLEPIPWADGSELKESAWVVTVMHAPARPERATRGEWAAYDWWTSRHGFAPLIRVHGLRADRQELFCVVVKSEASY